MIARRNLPILFFASAGEWTAWLENHHAVSEGLWLKIAKSDSGVESVSYAQALDAALCFGWIDGQKDRFDERHWLQRFTPRGPRSTWSRVNRERASELIEEGEMRPAGLEAVERAKADGRWQAAYEGQRTATVPDDLQRALAQNPEARAFFSTLDRRNRYAILYRIGDAKRADTRARRIGTFVAMLGRREKLYP